MNGRSEIGWDPFCDCSQAVGSADIWDNLVSDDGEFYAHVNTVQNLVLWLGNMNHSFIYV